MNEQSQMDAAFLDELRTYHEIQKWLYHEARLLDEERFEEWLALLTPDIHYWLPLRENRFRKDRRPAPTPATSASDISVLRSRRQDEENTFNAKRQDLFRKVDGRWKLARRHILATHHVFLDENVCLFF